MKSCSVIDQYFTDYYGVVFRKLCRTNFGHHRKHRNNGKSLGSKATSSH